MVRLSAVVRTCTGKDEIFELLDAIKTQTVPPDEVVLLDSGSTERVISQLRELAGTGLKLATDRVVPVKLIEIPRGTWQSARALNQAIEASAGEYISIISQDALPANDYYHEKLLEAFRNPRVAGSYARQILRDQYCPLGEKDLIKTYPDKSRLQEAPICWFVNTCSMVPRALWEKHHFDEDALISEDHEWGKWAQSQGFLIQYEANAIVRHFHTDNFKQLWWRYKNEAIGLARIHGTRPGLARSIYRYIREVASDTLWLTARGKLWHIPRSVVRRGVKYAAYYAGGRAR